MSCHLNQKDRNDNRMDIDKVTRAKIQHLSIMSRSARLILDNKRVVTIKWTEIKSTGRYC